MASSKGTIFGNQSWFFAKNADVSKIEGVLVLNTSF